ncbi:hypothetical protein HJC23_009236 [Cyclotella cryptica]|uniref:EamA domain-containing protein n=1 Tax=Cyclotella cryptica TaxID=29204 RepID=A0ABD3Q5W1_9STRA|eukprot:CCRYP_008486-RA/>CCRYP_008486-RA protein AED:0.10 eAED:0.10 QI:0/-1/0/1/-1/1/1/0/586
MSLLAMIADNFELEPPEGDGDDSYYLRPVDNTPTSLSLLGDPFNDDDAGKAQPLLLYHDLQEDNIPRATSDGVSSNTNASRSSKNETKLLLSFFLMLIIGTLNKIFQKLQAIPMYNYPNSLNLLQNFVYVPLCFIYIIPVAKFGLLGNAIPTEVSKMSKKPFVIMGLLDCVTCLLMTYAAVHLPGSLLILLPQAAIPISMLLSNRIKGEKYKSYQYLGAMVVIMGIMVVLEPLMTRRHRADYVCQAVDEAEFCALCSEETLQDGCLSHRTKGESKFQALFGESMLDYTTYSHDVLLGYGEDSTASTSGIDDPDGSVCKWIPASSSTASSTSESSSTILLWSIVTILACIPMTMSSIYKEMTLSGDSSNVDIDPIFLNGWVAFFQFLFSFPLAFPAGMTSNPPVTPSELPSNILDGIKCYVGKGTIDGGCHPDHLCHLAPLYVNMFLLFNVGFNILIVYILKFGSANVLFMAGTIMVPLGNVAFALPFMPGSMPLHDSDISGLIVIITGLVTYRFGSSFRCKRLMSSLRNIPPCPWRRGKNRYRKNPEIVFNEKPFEWGATIHLEDNDYLGKVPSTEVMQCLLPQLS